MISSLFWEGNEARLIELVEKGVIEAYTSSHILDEFERVLYGSKFKLQKDDISNLMEYLIALMHVIAPKSVANVIHEDPSDNRIIECALEIEADLIVTGDRHLLALRDFKGIKIRTSSEALELIGK